MLYRYEYENMVETGRIRLLTFHVIKETPKGYWINPDMYSMRRKWCSKTSKKCFAYTSKKRAKENYIARTNMRISILKGQMSQCYTGLALMELVEVE